MNIDMNKPSIQNILYKYVLSTLLIFVSSFAYSQCSPQLTMKDGQQGVMDTFCVGEIISFRANSPGYTTAPQWDFGDGVGNSVQQNPTYAYQTSGTFTITFKGDGPAGQCTNTDLSVVIKPSPDVDVFVIDRDTQCFKDNKFCFRDTSSAPEGNIIRVTYLFSDGQKYDTIFNDGQARKKLDNTICHTILDPSGGSFDLVVEVEDESGCIARVEYKDIIYVHPKIGTEFNNITPRPNPGCDSTLGIFENTSTVPLADIDSFYWDWGDGESVGGNRTTNTEWWFGPDNDNKVSHMYRTQGLFDGSLIVEAYGCVDVFTWKSAVGNIILDPRIVADPDPACTPDNPIEFSVENLDGTPVDRFLWNFGDPPAGPANLNDKTLTPNKAYGPGPWMISLRLFAGPCDITIYDTVQLIGPGSTIEVAFDRVAEDETYQCLIRDSIHFPNNSSYYQNDWNRFDEDSAVYYYDCTFDYQYDYTSGFYSLHYREYEELNRGNTKTLDSTYAPTDTIKKKAYKVYFDTAKDSIAAIRLGDTTWHRLVYDPAKGGKSYRFGVNPRRRWVFNYTPPVGKGGVGIGDQTAVDPLTPIIRNYNPNVWRVWEMGDQYAPQCTTDSRPWVNKNVGINCNWTIDSTPVHWYTPWDEIYQTFQDGRNYTTPIRETRLFKNGDRSRCYQVNIFPSNPMIVQGDTVLTVPLDSTLIYRGDTIKPGVIYPQNRLGNWIVKRPPSCFIGTELYWDPALDTFVAVNNLTDTTYHTEDWLGRNNITAGNAKTTWTAAFHEMDVFIPAGVTINTLQLAAPGGGGANVGRTRSFTGPQTVTLDANEQFEISSNDSIKVLIKIEENESDTTFATPSRIPVLREQFGILVETEISQIIVDSAKHREEWFLENAQCFNVTLWQQDTIHPLMCESEGTKSLALIPPNANGLEWASGLPCPFDGSNLNYILTFNITETKPGCTQRWFAANLDSLADPNNFIPYNGGLLAPPPPGLPIPFVLPYDIRGNLGGEFVKGYTPGEIGNDPTLRNPNGSFTLGLIVGNGRMVPQQGGGMLPECLDTFWYNDLFRILYLNAGFTILEPTTPRKVICAGGEAVFRINEPIQDSISVLRWAWGYQGIGRGPTLDIYVEQFKYYEKYNGPVAGRNDANVIWSPSDDWLYNYVIRQTITDFGGLEIIDTIVTTIIKDYRIVADTRNADGAVKDAFEQLLGLNYSELPPEDIPLYLGDGTSGCLDTTGLSQFFRFGKKAYSEKVDPDVWVEGDRRMRCRVYSPMFLYDTTVTTESITVPDTTFFTDMAGNRVKSQVDPTQDSVTSIQTRQENVQVNVIDSTNNYNRDDCVNSYEVSQILHFRDSSLQGYDTLLQDTSGNGQLDTIAGVWRKQYVFPEEVTPDPCFPGAKDTIFRAGNGPMIPTLFLNNTDGCEARSGNLLNVGFYNEYWLENENLCEGASLLVEDSLRYYQYGEEDPFTYPIKEIPFWQTPDRVANLIEFHKAFWGDGDSSVGSIVLNHRYKNPGKYDITIIAKDSIGCRDTSVLTAYISRLHPDFLGDSVISCESIVNFTDSSWVDDPCRDTCADGTILSCEKVIRWEWDFGDGTRKSLLQNPSHNYTSGGSFDVTLKVWSELGCEDSITKRIYIPGPRPEFEFDLGGLTDTIEICLGDSVFLKNLSKSDGNNPSLLMNWGDGNFSDPPAGSEKYGHVYQRADTFILWLAMQDVMPDGNSCTRVFPDSSESQLVQRRMVAIVKPLPEVHISADDTLVCPNEVINFTIDSLDERYTRLVWLSSEGDSLNRATTTDRTWSRSFSSPGNYWVAQAPEYDILPRCWGRDSVFVRVAGVEAKFSIDSSDRPNFCFINESVDADSTKYEWSFEDDPLPGSSNEVNPCYNWDNRTGTYEVCLIAQSSIGCMDTVCQLVNNSYVRRLVVYNVFTPEGDIRNNEFVIDGEGLEEYNIKIYNRWGEKVFESDDINTSWNGKVDNTKSDCPEGTYFYIINYKFEFGEENEGQGPIEGQVELIRQP